MTSNLPDSRKVKLLLTQISLLIIALTASTAATAQLHVGAIMDGRGSKSLVAGKLKLADRVLPNRVSNHLTFADTNNLCVLQILQGVEATAIGTCKKAHLKLQSTRMKRSAKASLLADVLNNLAVAQWLAGDRAEAQRSLAAALSQSDAANEASSNALANQAEFQRRVALAAK